MTKKLQILSMNILNSNFRIIFTIIIYLSIYFFFYGDKIICYCMEEQNIPSIAEAKPTSRIAKSIIRREISSFLGFAETLQESKQTTNNQEKIISEQKEIIQELRLVTEELNMQRIGLQSKILRQEAEYNALKVHTDRLQEELIRFNQQRKKAVQEYNDFLRILSEEQSKPSRKR